jgi:hypothetical protein
MPRADRRLVKSWISRGHDPLSALTSSGLLVDERRHPDQGGAQDPYARKLMRLQEPLSTQLDHEISEHEAAHAWCAL